MICYYLLLSPLLLLVLLLFYVCSHLHFALLYADLCAALGPDKVRHI